MTTIRVHRDLTIQNMLDACPSAREVFFARRMACVGCDLAPFMTIGEAEAAYGIPPGELEQELRAAAAKAGRANQTEQIGSCQP